MVYEFYGLSEKEFEILENINSMDSITKNDIIGNWENDAIRYEFYKLGCIEIYLKHTQTSFEGEYEIDNDSISVKYGKEREMFWKGKINYVTKTELSITDESNDVGTIDILFKEEVVMPKSFIGNEEKIVSKKNFTTLLVDFTSSFFGVVFLLAMFGFIGYMFYKKFAVMSHQQQSLQYAIFTFSLLIIVFFYFASKNSLGDSIDKAFDYYGATLFLIPLSIFIIVPIFIVFVKILIFLLTFWFFWYTILLVIMLVFVWLTQLSTIKKIILSGIIILTIYFLFGAKEILRFDFKPFFDNEKIYLGNSLE